MATKKSLYEILEVPPHATYADIQASHQRLLQALEDKRDLLSREDYTLQMRLLKVAYSTLCTPTSRDAYDAHLTTRSDPGQVAFSIAGDNARCHHPGARIAGGRDVAQGRGFVVTRRRDRTQGGFCWRACGC
jgi:DnaJ-class molecular chaperone